MCGPGSRRRFWKSGSSKFARLGSCTWPRTASSSPTKSATPSEAFAWTASGELGRFSGLRLENPLLRSGLALAGGNTWLDRRPLPPEAEDGLLTAEDVTGLDLLDTELVVLSACNTGLGEIRTGEGVFGLRRAFVLAGAKTLVMSLWKVPDEQTQRADGGLLPPHAGRRRRGRGLATAQLALKAKYPEPYYWGAFICQGNPGPLADKIDVPTEIASLRISGIES